TPAWTNTNRVNKANQFTPRPVQLSSIRPTLSTASKTIKTGRVNVNTGYGNVSTGSVHVNSGTQIKSSSSRFNTGKLHVNSGIVHLNLSLVLLDLILASNMSPVNRPFSRNTAQYAVKGKMGTAVKTSAGCVWRKAIPLSNTNSGPTSDSNVNISRGPQGIPKPMKAWDQLEYFEEVNRGSVTFGGSIGYIAGASGLTSPKQTATGKGISNPLMAVMVCQKPYAKELTTPELMANCFGDDASKQGRIDIGNINTNAEITLIHETQGRINDIIADEDITLIS
ncbi:hypothetical protein Tco_0780609, partial [Tanacetum coccineum]